MTIDFAQLWPTEQETLANLAAAVPNDGIIVEIGTAQGGSAYIMACNSQAHIYSYDPAPSEEAREHLRGKGQVHLSSYPSVKGAAIWKGPPIDLLFIDGSHFLKDIVDDYNAWVPKLKQGGILVMHDFDSPERGGIAHLAMRVVGDTIMRKNLLINLKHSDRLLYGKVSVHFPITLHDCLETWHEIAQELLDYPDGPFLPNLRKYRNGLSICYMLNAELWDNYNECLATAKARPLFLKWTEILSMFEHAHQDIQFPILNCKYDSLLGMSQAVAHEQVRVILLWRILETMVDYTL